MMSSAQSASPEEFQRQAQPELGQQGKFKSDRALLELELFEASTHSSSDIRRARSIAFIEHGIAIADAQIVSKLAPEEQTKWESWKAACRKALGDLQNQHPIIMQTETAPLGEPVVSISTGGGMGPKHDVPVGSQLPMYDKATMDLHDRQWQALLSWVKGLAQFLASHGLLKQRSPRMSEIVPLTPREIFQRPKPRPIARREAEEPEGEKDAN